MADKNVLLHDASNNNLYPLTKGANITGTVPISNGGTGADNAADALGNLLGHSSVVSNYIAYAGGAYENNLTYDYLGIPSGGKLLMVSPHQQHSNGVDDVYHSVFLGYSWNDTSRVLFTRLYSTRSSQANIQIRFDCIFTK